MPICFAIKFIQVEYHIRKKASKEFRIMLFRDTIHEWWSDSEEAPSNDTGKVHFVYFEISFECILSRLIFLMFTDM